MSKKNCSIEGKTKVVLNLLSDMAVIVDEKGRLVIVNDVFEEVTGLSQKEVTGKSFLEIGILPAESKKILLENLMKRLQGFPVEPYEVYFTDKTGKSKCVEVKGRKVSYAGQPADLVVFHDITPRKENARRIKEYSERMEALVNEKVKEVKESEERYRELTESISDVFFAMDKDLRYTYWNKASEKLTGILAKDAIGKSLTEVFPNVKGTEVEQFYQEVLRTKKSQSFLNNYKVGDKELVFEISAYPAMDGLSLFVKDITERKKMEEALRESEEKYKNLVENSKDSIVIIDLKGNVQFANKATEELTGYTHEEGVGINVRKITPLRYWPKSLAMLLRARKGEQIPHFESMIKRKDGRLIPVESGGQAIFKDGKVVGVQIITRDISERRMAEEKIRESEEKYRSLFELAPDSIMTFDLKGVVTSCNTAATIMSGYSKDELVGKHFSKMAAVRARDIPKYLKIFTSIVRGKMPKPFEIVWKDKNGTPHSGEVHCSLMKEKDKLVGTQVIMRDITERKKMEQALSKSEEKYRKLFEESNDAIFVAGAETGIIIDCNHRATELTGKSRSELIGQHQRTLHPQTETEGEFSRTFKMHLKEKEGQPLRSQVITKSGEIRDVSITAGQLDLEDKKLVFGSFRDITEEKKLQDALKKEHYKLETIANSIGAGFVVISKDYRILWENKFIRDYKGDVDGKLCYATLNSLNAPCPDCGVKKVFEQGVLVDSHEYCSTDVKGNQYWVEIVATPIKDENGNVISAIEIAVDITEKKKMQEQLAEYSMRLEQLVEERTNQLKEMQDKLVKSERLAAIGELAGMVGHDLRNPLTGIKNAAYYLGVKQGSCSEEDRKKMLGVIDSAIANADKIISDLQEYSREMQLELVNCSPRSILKEALSLVQVPDRVKIIDNTLEEPLINVDNAKMVRVFINLIKNAVDAMPNGGTLQVKSTQKNGNVEISFADTGMGMSKETLAKLFSPLVTTKAQGMGFGLAICKRIVEAHQGRITVESVEGKGSTFTLTVPIEPELKDGGEETWINVPESLLSTTTKT
jgi:PAS domain S-box-containing protein